MKIDGPFYAQLPQAAEEAERLAAAGYDGVYTLEGSWESFLHPAIATELAPGMDIATGMTIEFPQLAGRGSEG
ncbi:hypothetical protein [Halioglobus maricola]|nr:hypothetical protein [Halioglobus maricola]